MTIVNTFQPNKQMRQYKENYSDFFSLLECIFTEMLLKQYCSQKIKEIINTVRKKKITHNWNPEATL